uniref:Ventricular zone expressed PH domain-containing 1 n=1 Tax=Erpetoichthys calabaricus TaxID=27687 RepID=A0A8C4SDW1_ERPCA
MHQLFSIVLGQRDLSRAGDLFSLEDIEIKDSLSEALEEMKKISSSSDYLTNDNDQAVIEICITRITTAIRETNTIEQHALALVSLWESCLECNLKTEGKNEDTPHAKIASDIMSSILQNYNKPQVMALAVPVAMKFLQRGNKETCRNMSSYISLVAIAKADLLVNHTEAITKSVLQGNFMLLRVLPSLYEQKPESINMHLTALVELLFSLDQSEQHHLFRLLQITAKHYPEVLNNSLSSLMTHLHDPNQNDSVLTILLEVSRSNPSAVASFLPRLKEVGEEFPSLLGQIAKIYGAIGHTNEERARSCLAYLVTLLANMDHTFHHVLLMEIKGITDMFSNILGANSKDIYRMSNSFTYVAMLLGKKLEISNSSQIDTRENSTLCNLESTTNAGSQKEDLTEKIYAHEDKILTENKSSRHVPRSQSLTNSTNLEIDNGKENGEMPTVCFSESALSQESCHSPSGVDDDTTESFSTPNPCSSTFIMKCSTEMLSESCQENNGTMEKGPQENRDKLWRHLKENLTKVQAYYNAVKRKIPIPDQCTFEDSVRNVIKLHFTCPLKGHYCLYSKSSFTLNSRQPQVWIQIMLIVKQSLSTEPLSISDTSVQLLKSLWDTTHLNSICSFESAMIHAAFPQNKDLDCVLKHLEEVRFFDLFGYSEEMGEWLCFMCNNPEKANVLNQDGQPLIEGKLKEKQVRWKFIKRWKTRYFTLAGNQLLFRKGKSKDEVDDNPIELSKVQSVKVVAKKRRDRSLPRAFEIFTDNKTYVFKAKDEKNAEEWLQCINVAVAQAKERENREATTYL